MNIFRKLLISAMIAAMLICAGCDNNQGGSSTNTENPKSNKSNNTGEVLTTPDDKDKVPEMPPKPSSKSETDNTKAKSEHAKEMNIKVYYPDESGLRLVSVNREIAVSDNNDKYKAAVEAVMTPPTEKNLTSIIPNNKSLISVKVKDGTAVVNLDKNIKNGFVGGSTGEEFLIGSVVNTLTEFSEIKDVKFLIDGKDVETLSGHMDLSEPIKRMDELMKN